MFRESAIVDALDTSGAYSQVANSEFDGVCRETQGRLPSPPKTIRDINAGGRLEMPPEKSVHLGDGLPSSQDTRPISQDVLET